MNESHEIIRRVLLAQDDPRAADELISQYMPFIRSETAKFIKRIPQEGCDDELSIAMFAFYEAAMKYQSGRGSFLKLASLSIRSRLIDYQRKEKRHTGLISLDQPIGDEDGMTVLETVDSGKDEIGELTLRSAAKEEIREFSEKLASIGISLADVAEQSPQQERTRTACMNLLKYAQMHPELLRQLETSGRLPVQQLTEGTGVDKKTVERHRKYIAAILLAYTNGYEIIRGHLYHLREKGVTKA